MGEVPLYPPRHDPRPPRPMQYMAAMLTSKYTRCIKTRTRTLNSRLQGYLAHEKQHTPGLYNRIRPRALW